MAENTLTMRKQIDVNDKEVFSGSHNIWEAVDQCHQNSKAFVKFVPLGSRNVFKIKQWIRPNAVISVGGIGECVCGRNNQVNGGPGKRAV
jgi:hypothetical protein